MKKLFDRIVDAVDEHADRYISAIENFLFFLVFLFIFVFFLHLAAIAISEGGNHVTIPRHKIDHPSGEEYPGSHGDPSLDRQGMGARPFKFESDPKTHSEA
jgi:hypothetical protein